jgi:outer membrane protein assembly factor BamB
MKRIIHTCSITFWAIVALAGALWFFVAGARTDESNAPTAADADKLAARILAAHDANAGLCVLLGVRDGSLPVALARNGKLLVHGLSMNDAAVERVRQDAARANLAGVVSVESGSYGPLPYADNLVNLLIVDDLAGLLDEGLLVKEIVRVLRPGGVAWLGQADGTGRQLDEKRLKESLAAAGIKDCKFTAAHGDWAVFSRPRPSSMDQWTHPRYNATGNAVSMDKEVGVPTGVRWLAGPQWPTGYRKSSVHASVATENRLVYVFEDEISTPGGPQPRNSLVARDAYNGLLLWNRQTGKSRNSLVSIGERIYTFIKDGGPLVSLDAKTGELLRTFEGTAGPANLPAKLLAVPTPPTPGGRGGEGRLIVALADGLGCFDADSGELRWKQKLLPESYVASDHRVFVQVNNSRRGGKSLFVCLDLDSGKEIWSAATTWSKSSPTLVFYQDGILIAASSDGNHAISAENGKHLWTYKYPLIGHGGSYVKVLYMDNLVWVHSAGPKSKREYAWEGLDPKSGQVRKRLVQPEGFRLSHRCSYDVATERYFLCGSMDFADLESGAYEHFTAARNSCRSAGVLPANGLLYSFPHGCGCYAMLRGFMGLSSQPLPVQVEQFDSMTGARLQRGPAFGNVENTPASADDWLTYRHDSKRTASTDSPGPAKLTTQWTAAVDAVENSSVAADWQFKTGGIVSSPVIANGLAYVAVSDRQRLSAYDVGTGKLKWVYTVGGRIDCPPTIANGLCLFGSADGWVYCLRASDGELVWRFRAAPMERRVLAYGQLESAWPVLGGVLVYDGLAYFGCGRHSGSDGGVFVYAVDPASGELVWAKRADKLNGVADVLTAGEGVVQMAAAQFDARTGKTSEADEPRLRGGRLGLLDDSWYKRPIAMRRNLQMWSAEERPTGQILAFNDDLTCGYLACSKVNGGTGAMSGHASLFAEPENRKARDWSVKLPLTVRISGMALTPERLYVAGQLHDDPEDVPDRHVVRIYALDDGRMLAEHAVSEPLTHDCLAVSGRRLFLTTRTGKLICLGEP